MTKQQRVELIAMYLKVMRLPKFTTDGRETLDYEGFDKGVEAILKLTRGGNMLSEWEDFHEELEAMRSRGGR